MERYAYKEAFGFATDVMVSTIKGCTIVDMFIVIVLECIMTHSFVSLDMFFLVSFVTMITAQDSSLLK